MFRQLHLCLVASLLLGVLSAFHTYSATAQIVSEDIQDEFATAKQPFAKLDKRPIWTKLLRGQAVPLVDIERFDGNSSHSEDRSLDASSYVMAVATLASMATKESKAREIMGILDTTRLRESSSVVNIAAAYFRYHKLRPSALAEGLVTVDRNRGQVLDVPERFRNPYEIGEAVIATSKTDRVSGRQVTFRFDEADFYANSGSADVRFIELDGTRYSFSPGKSLTHTFSQDGFHAVTIHLYRGARLYKAHTQINIVSVAVQARTGFDEKISIDGGGGTLDIFSSDLGKCGFEITKPILFVGGFDPSNDRGFEDVTNNRLLRQITNEQNAGIYRTLTVRQSLELAG